MFLETEEDPLPAHTMKVYRGVDVSTHSKPQYDMEKWSAVHAMVYGGVDVILHSFFTLSTTWR